ncbi:Flp family type IVb pilin [Enterovibrio sp. ZSDZ35]|uniref:Flp family type IVb pilin n=1 Tax=Enterovibrio qingdaonensis TaxID=2899818 RepID=A0ABT5QL83_9GAMM|nr:Flp family type IVb pilin [Enterovibrio sp. ZSDZ35]MDD1781734.1 Flp family type IVb pilin [Enterovibrio sp. ZSDZ35]
MMLSNFVKAFVRDERGVTAIEYAIIGVAISAILMAVFANNGTLGGALDGAMTFISTQITSAQTGPGT